MIVAGIVWLTGAICAWAIGALHIALTPKFEPRYSATEVFWSGAFWPVVVLILVGVEVYVRVKAVRS